MRRRMVVAVLCVAGLAAPAAAHGELSVSGPSSTLGESGPTTIDVVPAKPAAGVAVLAPPGFTADIEQAQGAAIGRGSATLRVDGSAAEIEGDLVAVDPAEAVCGAAGHDAVWRLSGKAGAVLVAVDRVVAGDPEAAYASYRLDACPAAGTLASLELRLDRVFTTGDRPGEYVWRAVATPADGAGAPLPSEAVESRSTQELPVRVTLRGASQRASGAALLSGLVTAAGSTVAGVRVALSAGRPGSTLVPVGSTTTGSQGRFRARRTLVRTTAFQATSRIPSRPDPAGCPAPIAPGGCDSATIAAASAASKRVTVRVPVLRTLRLGSRGADVRRLRADLVRLRYLPAGAGGASFDERTWHAVVAFQGLLGLGRTGVVDRRTWRALARARVPAPWARLARGVLIDTARQVLLLVERGKTVRAIHVSTGAYGRTPKGRFAVYRKEILSWSVPFSTWMPYASYFSGGFAMHSYPSVPAYPASHGCVRLPAVEAPGVYAFAGYGTPVWIR